MGKQIARARNASKITKYKDRHEEKGHSDKGAGKGTGSREEMKREHANTTRTRGRPKSTNRETNTCN